MVIYPVWFSAFTVKNLPTDKGNIFRSNQMQNHNSQLHI
jgi:hypothetical protein